ncbi:MAG: hypothetical protein U9Q74_15735 [Gemmatimonadota bacterium]|nr:hypothetical protein [Gemmatimonadota bacterium]
MSDLVVPYPPAGAARDAWILSRRPPRNAVAPDRAYGTFVEPEAGADGVVRDAATILLTNRECPWKCVMCDLWMNTLEVSVPPGAIRAQLDAALDGLPRTTVIKLYNAGSFFDAKAIPPGDFVSIAERLSVFDRVIVECHPALVGPPVREFASLLTGTLEVAMGLEVADDRILDLLNKRMTLAMYAAAAAQLGEMGVDHRAFVLVQPPFVASADAVRMAVESARFAFAQGATAVSLIPTRGGNGAMQALAHAGHFARPALATLEDAHDATLALGSGRVFADVWDLARFSVCDTCFPAREARLREMNLTQRPLPRVACDRCRAWV